MSIAGIAPLETLSRHMNEDLMFECSARVVGEMALLSSSGDMGLSTIESPGRVFASLAPRDTRGKGRSDLAEATMYIAQSQEKTEAVYYKI